MNFIAKTTCQCKLSSIPPAYYSNDTLAHCLRREVGIVTGKGWGGKKGVVEAGCVNQRLEVCGVLGG